MRQIEFIHVWRRCFIRSFVQRLGVIVLFSLPFGLASPLDLPLSPFSAGPAIHAVDSVQFDGDKDRDTSVIGPRMPRMLERANEIFDNTGDVNGVIQVPSSNLEHRPSSEQSFSVPSAFVLIGVTLGILLVLMFASIIKTFQAHHDAPRIVTPPEDSLLR
ncbi:hypothetical protein [Arcanobacterium haemolyticum]|uniref:Uncharacterized protein n=1 Tax=Arcanobacterium haemolyticum (strain ATCC 9345 / DSM 20595 / CCM 5947 / CCUG 17215 / LMG 16163 / NBRC 15585 / NCTC 8452 / 11018) TaxID=644284 RepID=D7BNN1_ARCHD|nr:hypothetical protein [Arcanobacterium haemolyticum]ADH92530.1 hypothetical protein Arch_0803 [Arcanobacterium haemolyticum DSM 20595]SPT74496.1 Uncharacterised protein [Arcanobacterium haemolyticum]SQH28737.1 Uncharacterised protein [Arcanobacterium haemolyticum]